MPDQIIIIVIATIFFEAICGFISLAIAKSKGYGPGWFFLGFFFDLVGIIVTLCIPDRNNRKQVLEERANEKAYWICPECGKTNNLNDKFCPQCGKQYDAAYKLEEDNWICGHCGAVNSPNNKFCRTCGLEKTRAESELEEKKITQEYLEEHGFECEMCGNKALKLYKVKIEDDMGTRYRNVCENCLKKYNCTIIE